MVNKPIIINGVDVSGCCQYMHRYMEDYDIDTLDYCRHHFKPCKDVDVKYCYYKQLMRKEQECERLNEYSVGFARKCQKLELDVCHLKDKNYNLQRQLDQLKTENEEYKKNGIDLFEQLSNGLKANEKLKAHNEQAEQTLAEIKEIAEENIRIADLEGLNGVYRRGLAKQILQKINECEV